MKIQESALRSAYLVQPCWLSFVLEQPFGKLEPFFIRGLLRGAETETAGGTFGDTGRFKALVDPVHAEVAFADLAGIDVPLGNTPGAGGHAGLAPHTKRFLNKDNAVFIASLHGPGGTGIDTPGLFTVKTGHIDKIKHRKIVLHLRTDLDHLAVKGALAGIVLGFAVDFTGPAADALFNILGDEIFAHCFNLLGSLKNKFAELMCKCDID